MFKRDWSMSSKFINYYICNDEHNLEDLCFS